MRFLISFFIFIVVICISSNSFAITYGEDANCMGYWAMEDDGNETDLSGEGNHLTETSGDIPQDADRLFGDFSRDFERDETEWLVNTNTTNSLHIFGANQAISIVGFIKSESDPGISSFIAAKWDRSGDEMYHLRYTSTLDDIYFVLSNDGSSENNCIGATDVIDGTWHGIAGVYNDTDMRVYVDGSLDNNGASNPLTYSGGIFEGSGVEFWVGESEGTGTNYWDGLMDDVAVFNRELTSIEVSDINTNGINSEQGVAAVLSQVIIIN